MTSTTSTSTINALNTVFSRYRILEVVRSDNGSQYNSQKFVAFLEAYSFRHFTSSPLYPLSNKQTERAVQTVKKILYVVKYWRSKILVSLANGSQFAKI